MYASNLGLLLIVYLYSVVACLHVRMFICFLTIALEFSMNKVDYYFRLAVTKAADQR